MNSLEAAITQHITSGPSVEAGGGSDAPKVPGQVS